MAVELATAYVSLAVSSRGLGKDVARELAGTEGAAAAAGKRAGSRFSDGFSKVVDIGKKVSLGLGAAAIGAAGYGLKIAASNEQAQISFTTMLGSAKKAGKFLKDLQAFAAKTPFEFPELQTAASSLISAGINADKVIPIMTTLGDVTAGMGTGADGVKRATIAIQQMTAAGKISGEDLNQLRDAGIPVYDLLAKATGKAKEEVVALAQKGKLGSKELKQMMSALETGKGLERFSGLMDKQSASLSGMVSTFKDTLGQGLANEVQPLIPLIKDGLGVAGEKLAGLRPVVADGLKNVLTWSANLVKEWQAGQGAGGQLRDVFTGIKDAVVGVVDWFVRYRDILLPLGAAIATVVAGIKVWTLVTKTQAAISKGIIAVQAAMNAVMAANPIGIVVIAIAALVAALVVLYKRNETVRRIIDAAWAGIKRAVSAVVAWFRDTAWPILSRIFNAIGTVVKWLWTNIIKPHFNNMRIVIGAVASFIATTVWPKIKGAFDKIGSAGKWLWEKILRPAFNAMKPAVAAVGTAFSKTKDVIATAWGKLEGIAKKPIKFIINTVINDGLIGGYNWLAKKIGGSTLGRIPLPKGFKTGGVLPGYTPGRDVHRFYSATGGVLDLSGGEAVMRPEFTRLVGGKRGVDSLNAMARAGKLPFQAHAGGGIIGWIKSKAAKVWDWVKDKSSSVYKAVTNPLEFLKSKIPAIPGSDMLSELASNVKNRAVGLLAGKAKSLWNTFKGAFDKVDAERSGAGIGKNARGWSQLWGIVHKLLPGIQLTSSFRPGAITASGNQSYHSMGRAIDVAPPSMAAFNKIKKAFPNATELIYSPAGFGQLKNGRPYVYGEPVRSMHYNHIHLAMKKGGIVPKPLLFDNGGVLPQGTSLVHNATGAPEPLGRLDRMGGPMYIDITVAIDDLAKLNKLEDFLNMLDNARVNSRKTARSGRVSS